MPSRQAAAAEPSHERQTSKCIPAAMAAGLEKIEDAPETDNRDEPVNRTFTNASQSPLPLAWTQVKRRRIGAQENEIDGCCKDPACPRPSKKKVLFFPKKEEKKKESKKRVPRSPPVLLI